MTAPIITSFDYNELLNGAWLEFNKEGGAS